MMMMMMNQVMMDGNLNVDHHQKRNRIDQIVVNQEINPMMMNLVYLK